MLPNRGARRCIDRQDAGARRDDIHDAAVHDGDTFLIAHPQLFLEDLAKLSDVLTSDLLQGTETLCIVRPAVHQPVIRARIRKHLFCDRREALDSALRDLCAGRRRERHQSERRDKERSPGHWWPHLKLATFRAAPVSSRM